MIVTEQEMKLKVIECLPVQEISGKMNQLICINEMIFSEEITFNFLLYMKNMDTEKKKTWIQRS